MCEADMSGSGVGPSSGLWTEECVFGFFALCSEELKSAL